MIGASRRMGDLILGLLTIMLFWSFCGPSDKLDAHQTFVVDQIPITLNTVLKKFNLDCQTVTYAVCPACHCTYPPQFLPGSDKAIYPEECNNHPDPDTTCGAKLLKILPQGRIQPIKAFIYPKFEDYVALLLSREDLEEAIDHACDDLMDSINRKESPPAFVTDIFQAEFVRTFKGPEPDKLFVDRPSNEARLLFALNVDYFSAEGQTIRGASASCGIISAACLNLPLDIRYKSENMYVAIIPGPNEPSKTELNHYVRLVVDDFVVSWKRGVRYSRTARYAEGRVAKWALGPAVNDLPAARQFSQCAGHSSHHFCSRCSCYGRGTLHRVDVAHNDWMPKNAEDLRRKAEAWRTAPTHKDQENLFSTNGLRWTELWRLPYWDPAMMLVVDPMHCLLEGLAQHHFRVVLGLSESAAAKPMEDIVLPFQFQFPLPNQEYIDKFLQGRNDAKHISQIHDQLLSPMGKEGDDDDAHFLALQKRLLQKNLGALRFVLDSINIQPPPRQNSKLQCAEALINWVSSRMFWTFNSISYFMLAKAVSPQGPVQCSLS